MTNQNRPRRWYVAVPFVLFAVLAWDVTSRLLDAEKVAHEQFVRGFEVDASRREGMRDLLTRDVRSALQYALHSISDVQSLETNAERRDRLVSAFQQLGLMLRNSRYQFVEVFLTEKTPQNKLVLHGRYPTPLQLGEVDPSQSMLFAGVDLNDLELFEQHYQLIGVEDDPLLLISDAQPVMLSTRLILEGDENFSSWYMSVRGGLSDVHKSIDLVGQQMAGGVTPMRVITLDAQTDVCWTVWEVGKGVLDCDDAFLEEPVGYLTRDTNKAASELTYAIFQPTDTYRSFRAAPNDGSQAWRLFLPALLGFVLLITAISYVRYRGRSEGLMSAFMHSLSDKDSLNSSIHQVLSSHLEIMSRFTYAMRQKDVRGEERRYFDIAISEFLEASLSLNTLILERPPTEVNAPEDVPQIDLKKLTELAQMALEVATVDASVETKLFVPDDLPAEIPGYSYSVQTAVIAAINLSAQLTEEGRIEVSFWVDTESSPRCLCLRINDTGIGWGDLGDDLGSQGGANDNVARRALVSCFNFSGTVLVTQSETELGNEYVIKLCDGT